MSTLETGTRVRVIQNGKWPSGFVGMDGEVVEHRQGFLPVGVRLRFNSQPTWFAESELETITYS